jgi:ATP-dependent Clp protease adaptor protein ClpS
MPNVDSDGPDAPKDSQGASAVATQPKPAERKHEKVQKLPPFNVILLNDDDHSYEYVITMLRRIFGHPEPRGMQLARQVDSSGRAIVHTTHRELAELKRDQILAFGADPRITACRGSMSAVIEPAQAD